LIIIKRERKAEEEMTQQIKEEEKLSGERNRSIGTKKQGTREKKVK
jgi:hypothetical protein